MENRWIIRLIWVGYVMLASSVLPVALQATVQAVVGGDVLLPCPCSPDPDEHFLVWQIGQHTTVAYAITDRNTDDTATQYRGRTRLFYPADGRNCSLLLRSVRASDANTYSCYYKHPEIVNFTVALKVVGRYSLQCSVNSSAGYQCRASGGFPARRVHWLQGGQAVEEPQGSVSELQAQDPDTDLYNITSTLRNSSLASQPLQCVVEDPLQQKNITAECTNEAGEMGASVSAQLQTSLAVVFVLVLAAVVLIVFIKVWRPCHSSEVTGQYEPTPPDEGGTARPLP